MRHSLLAPLAILGLLLCGLTAGAQTLPQYATPSAGTGSNSFPLNTTTSNKVQLQYQAGEFGAPFLGRITHVYLQRSNTNANASTFTNLTVSMAQTPTWPAVTTAWYAPVTQVYTAPSTIIPGGTANDWFVIKLDTPFLYDPAEHLIVIVSQSAYSTGISLRNTTGSTPTPRRLWGPVTGTTPTGNDGTLYHFGFDMTPASGLYAGFEADVTIGAAPLRVQFTDKTFTSDPGGVTSWAWDFDGDLKVDATLQNPVHIYPTQNKTVAYDVTLTVTDASHPQSLLTRKGYITVDPPPKADFSATPTSGAIKPGGPPLLVRFTDLSVGATSWAWDFDGDNKVDSTVQNPIFPYFSGGSYSVTLSVAGVGGNDRITKVNYISVTDTPQLTTIYLGGNGLSGNAGCFFDIDVTNPGGIWITGFDVNGYTANTPFELEIHIAPLTYVGKETAPASWALVASGNAVSNARNTATPVETGDFFLPMGKYGIYVFNKGAGHSYTNLVATPPNNFYSNADLALTLGASATGLFTGSPIAGRVWNGTLYYITRGWPKFGPLGAGCAGTGGVPRLAAAMGSIPAIGRTVAVNLSGMPAGGGSALALVGFSKTRFGGFLPLPFDFAPLGAPGCMLLTDVILSLGVANVAGSGSYNLPLPNDPALIGGYAVTQALVVDLAANALGLTVTNGGELHIGN